MRDFSSILQHDVLEGQPGIGFGDLLRRDLEAGRGQQLGLDARGDDLGIDEHAVAIEDDKVWLGHGDPERGRRAAGGVKRRGIHQRGRPSQIRRPASPNIYADR